jgi:hypothetical protein
MRRFDWRLAIGAALVLLGGLMLLERADLLPGGVEVFWSASFLAVAAYFLYRFATDTRGDWWAAIPGFALAGLAAESLPAFILGDLHGMFFLGALGLAFVAVYLSGRERWWALIPAGVLITLGLVAALATRFGVADNGGVLFVGIGVTFLLVAWLANMSWAYIPGIILLAMGALIGAALPGTAGLLWPAVLVVAGLILILRFSRRS